MTAFARVAVLFPGSMGGAVGAALAAGGSRVGSVLEGRSDETRERAREAGISAWPDLDAALREADLVLSILPPSEATALARACAESMSRSGRRVPYAECNAIAPETSREIAGILALGDDFIDGGIIGGPPQPGASGTRLYVSGPRAEELLALDAPEQGMIVRSLGPEVGRASAMKMSYAALTKGTMTLQAAVLMLARRHGLAEPFAEELQASQAAAWKRMGVLPFLPADAGRWIGEMEEIARTFREAGLPGGFHDAAADVYRAMAATPFARETRATVDRSRSLEEAIAAFLEAAQKLSEES